jgi:hypothetical protein
MPNDLDLRMMARCIELSRDSIVAGDLPFGCVICHGEEAEAMWRDRHRMIWRIITFRGCFGGVTQAADEVPRPRRIFPSTDTVASLSAARFRRTSIRHASSVGRLP